MHRPKDGILYITIFVTPVVEHWPEQEKFENWCVSTMQGCVCVCVCVCDSCVPTPNNSK